jgi:hypothetical protein
MSESKIIAQACEKWTNIFVKIFSNKIYLYLLNLFEKSVLIVKLSTKNLSKKEKEKKIIAIFQQQCIIVTDWLVTELKQQIKLLHDNPKYSGLNLNLFINTVIRCNLWIMSFVRSGNDINSIYIQSILVAKFVHKCYKKLQ